MVTQQNKKLILGILLTFIICIGSAILATYSTGPYGNYPNPGMHPGMIGPGSFNTSGVANPLWKFLGDLDISGDTVIGGDLNVSDGIILDGEKKTTWPSEGVPKDSVIMWMDITPPEGFTYTGRYVITDSVLWTTKTPIPTGGYPLSAATANNKIYVIGKSTNEEYDPTTDTWTTKTPMPTARTKFVVATVNNKIYAITGYIGGYNTKVNEEYDPATDTWITKTPIPHGRYSTAAAVAYDKIYVIGGSPTCHNTNDEYDPATDTWITKAPMPGNLMRSGRAGLAAATVNNKIYAIGGSCGSYASSNQEYNPLTDTWTKKADIPTQRDYLVAVSINNKIYAIGGLNEEDVNEEYNPSIDKWITRDQVPIPRFGFAAATLNDKIYIIGGRGVVSGAAVSVNEEYTPPITHYLMKKD